MKNVPVVILCEDQAQNTFVREFLTKRTFNPRLFRTLPLAGRNGGAGEAAVRSRFSSELKANRRKTNSLLVAVIDADRVTCQERMNALNQACVNDGVECRSRTDRVIVAIPRRNIETWFVYLMGGETNEETDEWKRKKDDLAKPAARSLHKMCYGDQKLRDPAPESLAAVCHEWKNATSI